MDESPREWKWASTGLRVLPLSSESVVDWISLEATSYRGTVILEDYSEGVSGTNHIAKCIN
jgi:hypothetical protein